MFDLDSRKNPLSGSNISYKNSNIRICSGTQNKLFLTFGPTFFISDFVLRIFFFIFLITIQTGIKE